MLVTFCNIALMPLFSLLSIFPPMHIDMLFLTVFVVIFMLNLPDVGFILFITFITACKTSSIKINLC